MRQNIYLIGSLRNPAIPGIGVELRKRGFDVFDDWYAAGPEADDKWQLYEQARGRTYKEALDHGHAGKHVFNFDLHHLSNANVGVLVLPAGKSGHLELGWLLGKGVPGYVLFDKVPDRWDVMYQFANGVFFNEQDLYDTLVTYH